MQLRERVWRTHRHREEWDFCPLCYSSLKWVRVGFDWCPCDMEPVLFEQGTGKLTVVKKKEFVTGCKIFRQGEVLKKMEYGLVPHVYTCEILKGGAK